MRGQLNPGWAKPFHKRKPAEEDCCIESIAKKSVKEKRNASDIAGGKASKGFGERRVAKSPNRKIGDEEKLNGAKKRGKRERKNGLMGTQIAADEHAETKTEIDNDHQLVDAYEEIAEE